MDKEIAILIAMGLVFTAIFSGVMIYAISDGDNSPIIDMNDPGGGFLPAFSTYEELNEFLGETHSDQFYFARSGLDSGSLSPEQTPTSSGPSDSAPDYSETNVQVQGIDEEDIVKTDGEFIYAVSFNQVTIIRAYPPEDMEVVANISSSEILGEEQNLINVAIRGIYISSEKLIVVSTATQYDQSARDDNYSIYYERSYQFTMISIIDLKDIEHPSLICSYGISGYFVTSRMMDDTVYAISLHYISYLENEHDFVIPKLCTEESTEEFQVDRILYDPDSVDSDDFLNIIAIDVESSELNYLSLIAAYSSTTYMSFDSLYITYERWNPGILLDSWRASTESTDDMKTIIYKIGVDELAMSVVAKGEVKGSLLNQFSMDEYDSNLRVATTVGWNEENNVYVLDENLNITGSLEGLAPTERIYSARFMGETLYLVTFRQVDPFFVIDLSDPENPAVLGELKIPGFSTYLHPIDEDHILGIGRIDSSIKISLFDVTDPMDPREISNYSIADMSYSEALYDHKAVLIDPEKELLSIPIQLYRDYSNGSQRGACVFTISIENGIEMRGIIEHGNEYLDSVRRSLYIGDYLYTLSDCKIKANDLGDLSEVNSLIYNLESYDHWYHIWSDSPVEIML